MVSTKMSLNRWVLTTPIDSSSASSALWDIRAFLLYLERLGVYSLHAVPVAHCTFSQFSNGSSAHFIVDTTHLRIP
uniref:Uncharacterized protein n=1 Tax=Mycena chlorophos TaxID=658473 RepID=A0ABQ0LMG7_MYCCL|nr:predicted protein [Mycena chlorophos]